MHFLEWGSCYNSGKEKNETSPSSENIEETVCILMYLHAYMDAYNLYVYLFLYNVVLFVVKSGKFHEAHPIACSTVGVDLFTSCACEH